MALIPLTLTLIFATNICHAEKIVAKAVLYDYRNRQNPTKLGTVTFTQETDAPVQISGSLDLRPIGSTNYKGVQRGFHIHDLGDLQNGCQSAQGHYNPHNDDHGAPRASTRHVGDLGNVEQGPNSAVINLNLRDSVISLTGPYSIIGRSVVLHQGTDDLGVGGNEESLKTGNAGARIGCGVIGIASTGYTAGSSTNTPIIILSFLSILLTVCML